MKFLKSKTFFAFFFIFILLLVTGVSAIFLMQGILKGNSKSKDFNLGQETKDYHIFITGTSENFSFINQIYSGALETAAEYNAAVQMYVPVSQAKKTSLQSLFDYASYLEPDGIIAFIEDSDISLEAPRFKNGQLIPLITTGNYNPELPQLSFIGINFSELGNIFSSEIKSSFRKNGNIIVFDNNSTNNPSYSTLMNVMTKNLQNDGINVQSMMVKQSLSTYIEDSVRQEIASANRLNIIVTLTEENTVLASQIITDLNQVGKIKIIGFGDGDNSKMYYEKGIVSKLISIAPKEIGKKAVCEFFEYKNNGYANSYVIADVEVHKQVKK